MAEAALTPDQIAEQSLLRLIESDPRFALTQATIRGVGYTVFQNQPASLRDYFESATQFADKEFIVEGPLRLTFGEVLDKSHRLSTALAERFDVKKGDRVLLAMRNHAEWIISYIAITSMGAIVVPLNAWWTSEELAVVVADSGGRLAIADAERLDRLQNLVDDGTLEAIGVQLSREANPKVPRFDDVLAETEPRRPTTLIDAQDDASILYTSGSTGEPKGVVSTHHAIIAVITCWHLIHEARTQAGLKLPEDEPCALLPIPLFHVTGCMAHFIASIVRGRKLVLMRKWDTEEAMHLIEQECVTTFTGVPTMTHELAVHPARTKYDLSSLIEVRCGGAARPVGQVRPLIDAFPNLDIGIGYGLTETNALGALCGGDAYAARPASTGRPTPPLIEMKIVKSNGSEAAMDEIGEIRIKSCSNMRGYWNKPEETAAVLTDGWLHTGDVGYLDADNYLFIVDRIKDIIIRGGENISCLEVESALCHHRGVMEACVFGTPDERLGEVPVAVVCERDGTTLAADDLKQFLKAHLAAFKIPERFWISRDRLPLGATGKIDRRGLRQAYRERIETATKGM